MHPRTLLALVTFPLVASFTYPVVVKDGGRARQAESSKSAQDPLAGLSDIQDVLSLVKDNYVDQPDMAKVVQGGIQSVLERAHSANSYITPDELRLADPGPAQVGLVVVKRGIWAQVLSVIPGSPAASVGFQAGDVIRKIDGESVGTLSAWALERKLRGPAGSQITLLRYVSANGELKKVVLTRALPQRPPLALRKDVKATLITFPDLSPGRAEELKTLLGGLDRKFPLILDLRSCAGGDLEEAARVAGLFYADGLFATLQEAGKPERMIPVMRGGSVFPGPSAAIIGQGTAGASEALASCFKKQGVVVLGERSSGMGIERERLPLRQGGAVEIVYRRWVGAGEEKLDRQGVLPSAALRGLQPEDDLLPKVLEVLAVRAQKAAADIKPVVEAPKLKVP